MSGPQSKDIQAVKKELDKCDVTPLPPLKFYEKPLKLQSNNTGTNCRELVSIKNVK